MKFAVAYRGISYKEDYRNENHLDTYKIDFHESIFFHQKYLINPLKEKGHEVGVFFNTYNSEKLSEYSNELSPLDVKIKDFDPNIKKYNFGNVANLIIETCEQVKNYMEKTNSYFDFLILNRFDITIFDDFTNLFLPSNSISVPTINDDCFIVISQDLLDIFIEIYKMYSTSCITHHMVFKFLEHGIRYHAFYPNRPGTECGENGPFWRLNRIMFNKDGHNVKEYNLQDVFNRKSKYFGFLYPPNKEFFSCKNLV